MKYELEQTIHYMMDNRPHSAPVLARTFVENVHEDFNCTAAQRETFVPFGLAGTFYSTCHGVLSENKVFASKDEMLESMK